MGGGFRYKYKAGASVPILFHSLLFSDAILWVLCSKKTIQKKITKIALFLGMWVPYIRSSLFSRAVRTLPIW